jgi:ribosomal protein S18 acetylase RimI-like enzyme
MIYFATSLEGVSPEHLEGFFVGWPKCPFPVTHLRILQGSSHVVLAKEQERVIGFITAISDGVLSAYIPLLEVLPAYQGRTIGRELVQRMIAQLEGHYMIELSCDETLNPFYEAMGLSTGHAMRKRNYDRRQGMLIPEESR